MANCYCDRRVWLLVNWKTVEASEGELYNHIYNFFLKLENSDRYQKSSQIFYPKSYIRKGSF